MNLRISSKAYTALYLFLTSIAIGKADTIILKDASSIEVYNVEVAGKWVLYTLDSNPDSELHRLSKDKVFAIKAEGGELRMVGDDTSSNSASKVSEMNDSGNTDATPQLVAVSVAEDNSDRIRLYNSPVLQLKKPKGEKDKTKICSEFLTIWGVTQESVLSDENIRIDFEMIIPPGPVKRIIPQYRTKITNKTSQPVYIDLANSFKFSPSGVAKPLFTNSVYSEGHSSSKGLSLNLGAVTGALGIGGAIGSLANGVGVGGGTTNSASVSKSEERILVIPPKGSVYLPPMKYTDGGKLREDYESLYIRTIPPKGALTSDSDFKRYDGNKGFMHALEEEGGIDDPSITTSTIGAPLGWIKEYDEQSSPKSLTRMLTYSTTPSFSTYTTVPYTLYVRGVMGSSQRWNVPCEYDTKYLESDDESHLLIGIGWVKDK